MNYRILFVAFFIFILCNTTHSQYLDMSTDKANKFTPTGNLQTDLVMQTSHNDVLDNSSNNTATNNRYSPLTAGLFSAVVPGAGQFYTKSYWQSAAFFGAEVITWIVYATFDKKGDQQTDIFQQYANDHWSVVRYFNWIRDPNNFGNVVNSANNPIIPNTENMPPWQQIDWNTLNSIEEQIGAIYNSGFTHKLAPYSDQQYYEMIGKYSQFGGGWDDAAIFQAGGYTRADVIANNGIGNVSPRFLEYRDMRGKANSYYNIATTVSYVIVANHIFSALEAALNASKINHRIQLQGHIQSRRIYGNFVEFVPTLQVKYGL